MESVREVLMSFRDYYNDRHNERIYKKEIEEFIIHYKLRPREPRANGRNEQAKEFDFCNDECKKLHFCPHISNNYMLCRMKSND